MVYHKKPSSFHPKFEVVSCYCEKGGEILLLRRALGKTQENRWGVPAGKVNDNETKEQAMVREMKEETGLSILSEKFSYIDKLFIKHEEYQFIYHMFHLLLTKDISIKINNAEHSEFKWISTSDTLKMDLVEDLDYCIKLFYKNI